MHTGINTYQPSIVFHPGITLKERLEELDMGPKEFGIRSGKPEKTIIAILKGESSITPEMAIQFENVLKIPAHFWLNKQRSYDEFIARQEQEKLLEKAKDWARKFPYADMANKGWVKKTSKAIEKAQNLFAFFGISKPSAWEQYYFERQLKVVFRISLKHTQEPYAIAAWLRQGELQAAELKAPAFDDKKFKEVLSDIKEIMTTHANDFFSQLQALCLEAGVKVVHTPCIEKAPINGSTRWLNDTPLIQLSGRYRRNDIFWFTFFHEAGHILLHGKKDVFLENIDYSDYNEAKEKEADDFAVKWTLTKEEEEEILKLSRITEKDIIKFAEKFNTHPAIIIGRLQRNKILPHYIGREFFEPIALS